HHAPQVVRDGELNGRPEGKLEPPLERLAGAFVNEDLGAERAPGEGNRRVPWIRNSHRGWRHARRSGPSETLGATARRGRRKPGEAELSRRHNWGAWNGV